MAPQAEQHQRLPANHQKVGRSMGPAVSSSRGCRHFGLELVAFRITRRYLSAIEAINLQSLAMAAPPNFYTNNPPSSIYKCADSTTSRYTFIKKSYIVWIVKASYSKKKKKIHLPKRFQFHSQAGGYIIWNILVRTDFFFNGIPAKQCEYGP